MKLRPSYDIRLKTVQIILRGSECDGVNQFISGEEGRAATSFDSYLVKKKFFGDFGCFFRGYGNDAHANEQLAQKVI